MQLGPGSGPVLVWGAPGTGKSTVLVESAVRRIEADGVDPAGVLLLAPVPAGGGPAAGPAERPSGPEPERLARADLGLLCL